MAQGKIQATGLQKAIHGAPEARPARHRRSIVRVRRNDGTPVPGPERAPVTSGSMQLLDIHNVCKDHGKNIMLADPRQSDRMQVMRNIRAK